MPEISVGPDAVTVAGSDRTLVHRPREVTLGDGTSIVHESRGGDLTSAWSVDLGGVFAEVVHLGRGPEGGELVLVLQELGVVSLGDLYRPGPPDVVDPEWPQTLDLAIGLLTDGTRVLTTSGEVTRTDVEDLHQRLLGVLHG